MIALVLVAFMAVLGLLIMFGRIGLRRFLGYPNVVDISCSILFVILFAGTFSGMVVAGFASLFMSLMLWVLRASIGAERLAWRAVQHKRGFVRWSTMQFYWQDIPASQCRPHWIMRLFRPANAL